MNAKKKQQEQGGREQRRKKKEPAAALPPLDTGYDGPVAPVVRNEGTAGPRRIVFIGASYKFVHRVLRDMLLTGGFDEAEVVVHDINPEPLKIVADLIERMARQAGSRMRIRRVLGRREALRGADAAILAITTGGQEADFRSFEVCAKYGIPVGVGDTLGPTALARNLRTVPVVLEMVRDMEELCPQAVLLNFTNPMSVLTGVMARHASFPVWGLCHSGDEVREHLARLFGVPGDAVRMLLAGVNHQSFVTRLEIAGADRTADILPASERQGGEIADSLTGVREDTRLQREICRLLGLWPSTGGSHLAEFYRFFFTPRRAGELGLDRHLKRIIPGRAPFGARPCPEILRQWAYGPAPVGDMHLLTSEHAHELLWSAFTGQPCTRSLNMLNSAGAVPGLPADACVEVMATVAGRRATAPVTPLPPAIHTLVSTWTTIHALTIRAACECDRDAARQALFLDPHVSDCLDIAPLLEDMLEATRPWLPRKWFKGARRP